MEAGVLRLLTTWKSKKAKLANEFNVAILYDIEGRSEVGALNERDETIIDNVS